MKIDGQMFKKVTDLESQKGPKRAPKGSPNRTQNESKSMIKIDANQNTSSRPSWSRLGTILGRLGTDRGVKHVDFSKVL